MLYIDSLVRRLRAGSPSAAKRSYPTSEVRGSGLECQAATAQEWPRGAAPHPRSGAARGSDLEEPPRA